MPPSRHAVGAMKKHVLAGMMWLATGMVGAAEPRNYSEDLATLYNEYQRVVALRDACVASDSARRKDITDAYQLWHTRHERIIDDLDNRFAAIVKRASKNQGEYVKNYAKYQSEVLQMREENKKALLADRANLARQCGEFAAYLRQPRSDIPAVHPAEFNSIYRIR
jgi:hypothetical protein